MGTCNAEERVKEILEKDFWEYIKKGGKEIELYNEFSFQHELGLYLRHELSQYGYKVQFERNTKYFAKNDTFRKHEIDIVVFKTDERDEFEKLAAIELKFPRHGQYPVRMFNCIEDILFMEELKERAHFKHTFVMAIVNHKVKGDKDDEIGRNFYDIHNKHLKKDNSIYKYFRTGVPLDRKTGTKVHESQEISEEISYRCQVAIDSTEEIKYPCNGKTKNSDKITPLKIIGSYNIEWRKFTEEYVGYLLETKI